MGEYLARAMMRYRCPRIEPALPRRAAGAQRVVAWGLALAALVFVPVALLPPVALAQSAASQVIDRRVKAVFLYKFLGYAVFPAAAFADGQTPLTIGVIGSDEMAAELARVVTGRQVGGRPIQVRMLREGEPGSPVHLLFIAGSDSERVAQILHAAPTAWLPVTECEFGLEFGSVINFRIIEERVRFDVSLASAERNNVKLSSRLLMVANRVLREQS